ncbi:MAG: sigma-54-dependent transcriptional regulator [Candidatus Sulfotelmatobacter sp.]
MIANPIETSRVLLVSKESAVLAMAESSSWELQTAANGWDAMEQVQSDEIPHLLVLDIPRGDPDSLQLLSWLRRLRPDLSVVVLCHAEDAGRRKEAIRLGAKDVLVRPFDERQLTQVIERHLGSPMADDKVEMASEDIESVGEDAFFLSVSPNMRKLRAQAELLAQADVPVLILGETGSGKGTVGRLIHKLSVRSGFKFLRVSCAEMPGDLLEIELFGRENGEANGSGRNPSKTSLGKLEIGEKGTILLDEITEMPRALQTKLLQVLEDKRFVRSANGTPVDVGVRILASSSHDVGRALAEKRLRADLYYRLSAFTVHVPPLRQRKEEINVLLRYSMHKFARYYGLPPREFSASALAACHAHSWPGNFKELETFVKRYLVAGDQELERGAWERDSLHEQEDREAVGVAPTGRVEAEPELDLTPTSLKSLVQSVKSEAERNAITGALEKTGWNRKAAARLLGVSYRTVLYKIEMYKIEQYAMSASPSYSSPLAGGRLMGLVHPKGSGKAS